MANIEELESALESERRDRLDAEERAARANERARNADDAYRKLQLEIVTANDAATAAREDAKRLDEKLAGLDV